MPKCDCGREINVLDVMHREKKERTCEICNSEYTSSETAEECRNLHKGIGYEKLDTKSPCLGPAKDPNFPKHGERRPDGSIAGFSWRNPRNGKLCYFRHDPVGSSGYLR